MKRPTLASCGARRPHPHPRPTPPSAASTSIATPAAHAAAKRYRPSAFPEASMSSIAILQQFYSGDYTVPRMLSRKWILVVFAIAFLCVLSQRCAAGPIKRRPPIVEIVDCTREFSLVSPSPFSQSPPFPPPPATVLHLDGIVLTHIMTPPEFRTPHPKATSATTDIFQALGWHPTCRLAPWLPRSY